MEDAAEPCAFFGTEAQLCLALDHLCCSPGVLPAPVKDIGRTSNWKDVISVWITIMTALQLNRKPSDHLTVQNVQKKSSAFESQLIQLTATKNHLYIPYISISLEFVGTHKCIQVNWGLPDPETIGYSSVAKRMQRAVSDCLWVMQPSMSTDPTIWLSFPSVIPEVIEITLGLQMRSWLALVMVSRPSIPSSPHNHGRCCRTLCLFWNRSLTGSGLWSLVLLEGHQEELSQHLIQFLYSSWCPSHPSQRYRLPIKLEGCHQRVDHNNDSLAVK